MSRQTLHCQKSNTSATLSERLAWQYVSVNWVHARTSASRRPLGHVDLLLLLAWQITFQWPRFGQMCILACMSPCDTYSVPAAIQLECSNALRPKASNLDTTSANIRSDCFIAHLELIVHGTRCRWLAAQPDLQTLSSILDVCGLVLEEAVPSPRGGASACHLCWDAGPGMQ